MVTGEFHQLSTSFQIRLINDAADSGVRWKTPAASSASKTVSALFLTFMYESLQVMIVGAFSAIASGIDVPLWAISNKRLMESIC